MVAMILDVGMFWDSWSIMRFSVGSFLNTYLFPMGSIYQKVSAIVGRTWSL